MKDKYDLLLMILDDLQIYIPIGIYMGILYLFKTLKPWEIYLYLLCGMVVANVIKWWWKR